MCSADTCDDAIPEDSALAAASASSPLSAPQSIPTASPNRAPRRTTFCPQCSSQLRLLPRKRSLRCIRLHAVFISGLPKLLCQDYLSGPNSTTMSLDIKDLA